MCERCTDLQGEGRWGWGGNFRDAGRKTAVPGARETPGPKSEMRTRFVLCGEVGQGPLMGLQKLSSPGAIP